MASSFKIITAAAGVGAAPATAAFERVFYLLPLTNPPIASPYSFSFDDAPSINSDDFCLRHPRGAFTTARTLGGPSKLFCLDAHIHRLVDTLQRMRAEGGLGEDCELPDHGAVGGAVRSVLATYLKHPPQLPEWGGELRVTLICYPGCSSFEGQITGEGKGGGGVKLAAMVDRLPPLRAPHCTVQIRQGHRENPEAKDTDWVLKRAQLKEEMPEGAEEVLISHDGLIAEGLSSNFFVIKEDGALQTSEGVLKGTIRNLVLEACGKVGVEVDPTPPRLGEWGGWRSAFITSTSRMLLPISTLLAHPDSTARPSEETLRLDPDEPTLARIRAEFDEISRQRTTDLSP